MRKTIAVVSTAGALLFGGAAVANAEISHAGVPASTTTTLAQEDYGTTNDNGNSGLWGLAGLLGLLGLLGLRHRPDDGADRAGITAGTRSDTPVRSHTPSTSGPTSTGMPGAGTTSAHGPGIATPGTASTRSTATGPSGTATAEPTTPYTPQTYPGTTPPAPTV